MFQTKPEHHICAYNCNRRTGFQDRKKIWGSRVLSSALVDSAHMSHKIQAFTECLRTFRASVCVSYDCLYLVPKVDPSQLIMKSGLAGERWFVAEVTSPFSAVTFCTEALVSNWSSSNFGPNFRFVWTGGVIEPSVGPVQLLW